MAPAGRARPARLTGRVHVRGMTQPGGYRRSAFPHHPGGQVQPGQVLPARDVPAQDRVGLGVHRGPDLRVAAEQVPEPRHGRGGGLAADEHQDGNMVGQLRGGQGLALLVAGHQQPGHQVVAVFGSGAGLPVAVDELADLTAPVRHGPVAEVLDSTFWVGPGLRDEFVSDAHDVGMAQAGHSVAKDG